MTEGVIVVSATPGTKSRAALVALEGSAAGPAGPIVRRATTAGGNLPARRRPRPFPRRTLALAVTDPSDIAVEATPARNRARAR